MPADDFLPVERYAQRTPEAIALAAPGRSPLTYRELGEWLPAARGALSQAGVGRGEVSAVALPTGPELITAFLAISGTGGCSPLDPSLTESEYRFYLTRLGARTLLVQEGTASPAASAARALGMRVLKIQPALDHSAGIFSVAVAAALEDAPAAPSFRTTDAALLLHTSATTGAPKLVPLTWGNLRAMAVREIQALQLSASDRFLSMMPLFHLAGLGSVLSQLSCGGTVISTAGFNPAALMTWLAEFQPTWLKSNPPLNRALLTLAREHPDIFQRRSLRFILTSGATPEPELLGLLEEAIGAAVLNGYGLTETGGVTRSTPCARKPGSTGRSSGMELAVVDSRGNLAPPEAEGEIVVRGPSVTAGYLDNQEANEAAFRGGWFHTGDLGRLDRDGFLFITGRLKEMINRGGEKILPQEVDDVLRAHPAVVEAAAFAVAHPTLGEEVAAAVVLENGAAVEERELRQFAATRLAPFKVPRRVVFIERIPRTATGKPQRGVLAEQFREAVSLRREPATPVEAALIEIWRRILHKDQISVDDDFFALGGDSLAAAVMLMDVQASLHTTAELLERVDFFDHPTVAELARIVAECGQQADPDWDRGDPREAGILGIRREGSRAPIFCFPANSLNPYYFRHLAKQLGEDQPFYILRHAEPVRDGRLLPVEEVARLAVAAIRRTCPRGPYLLCGHCYGGVIAFEAALQLIAQSEQVQYLVLLDVPAPGSQKLHKQWKRYVTQARDVVRSFARGSRTVTVGAVLEHVRALRRMAARRLAGRASRALTAMGSNALVAGQGIKKLHGMAMWEYKPREFAAPILHFIAADQPVSTQLLNDPRLGWREFACAGIEVRWLKGDHNTIFQAANAEAIAGQLEALLLAGRVTANPPAPLLSLAAKK